MMKWRNIFSMLFLFFFGLTLGIVWHMQGALLRLQQQMIRLENAQKKAVSLQAVQQKRFIEASKEIKHVVVGVVAVHAQTKQPKHIPVASELSKSMGSGIVIDTLGHILTNHHVIAQADSLLVHFSNGMHADAQLVGYDIVTDLAVLKVNPAVISHKKVITVAPEKSLHVGQWVLAVGNPYLNIIRNADPTVTAGVISALHRNFEMKNNVYYQDMIQTDAAINPGNSGGALINLDGAIVGINTFVFSGLSQDVASIGFSIPMERAMKIAKELIVYGKRRSVWTGVSVELASKEEPQETALLITTLTEKSPADKAGLEIGDTLVAVEQRWVHSVKDLSGLFLTYFPGDTLHVIVKRGNQELEKVLTLEEYTPKR